MYDRHAKGLLEILLPDRRDCLVDNDDGDRRMRPPQHAQIAHGQIAGAHHDEMATHALEVPELGRKQAHHGLEDGRCEQQGRREVHEPKRPTGQHRAARRRTQIDPADHEKREGVVGLGQPALVRKPRALGNVHASQEGTEGDEK